MPPPDEHHGRVRRALDTGARILFGPETAGRDPYWP